MLKEAVREIDFESRELGLIKPDSVQTFYPPKIVIPGLEKGIRRISGGTIELALGYGSTFSNDAAPDSVMDILLIVNNPRKFYEFNSGNRDIKLGTTRNPRFHEWWNKRKVNFYLGQMDLENSRVGMKIGVIGHDEFLKHARGVMPEAMENGTGKGHLYLAGRLQKAVLMPAYSEITPSKQDQIDQAINQARIDGVWLALGLVPRNFSFDQLAEKYVDLSYAADKRVDRADKPQSLFRKNHLYYLQMLGPILRCFREAEIISRVDGTTDQFEKIVSLSEEAVMARIKKSASHALRVNLLNAFTMGPINGGRYELAKFKRTKIAQS